MNKVQIVKTAKGDQAVIGTIAVCGSTHPMTLGVFPTFEEAEEFCAKKGYAYGNGRETVFPG